MPFTPESIPLFLSNGAMVALALVLYGVGLNHRPSRLLALFLVLRAAGSLVSHFLYLGTWVSEDPASAGVWAALQPYAFIPLPFILLYFLALYPKRRGWLGNSRYAGWTIFGVVLLLEVLYFFRHDLWIVQTFSTDNRALFEPNGPLAALLGLTYFMAAVASLMLTKAAHDEPPGPRRQTLLLLGIAFFIDAMPDVVGLYFYWLAGDVGLNPRTVPVLAALFVGAFTVRWFIRMARNGLDQDRRRARWALAVSLVLGPALGALAYIDALLPASGDFQTLLVIPTGLVRLMMPVLATYALLRHSLFDLELKFQWTIRQSTVGGIVAMMFFVTSEFLEQVIPLDAILASLGLGNTILGARWSIAFGITVAALVAIGLQPLQRAARRVADRTLPGVQEDDYLEERKREVYRTALEEILRDEHVSARERETLDRLKARLEIPDEAARVMETEVASRIHRSPAVAAT